ncbi:MAG TPA: divalent metal cation transporter, partial [Alicyclobacillus sp.]|nr:divalent metal cation transporter [Alicyclobacillus sp.]
MKKGTTMATSVAYGDVAQKRFQQRVERARSHRVSWRRWMVLLWLTLGPGVLVMIGDNDAGGVITYAQTGAAYGWSLF